MQTRYYRINVTKQAEEQIRGIVRYIAFVLENPDAALNLLEQFDFGMDSLKKFPQRAALTEGKWGTFGIRYLVVNNYLMYFIVEEKLLEVQIIAVVYGGREQNNFLTELIEK